MFIWSHYLLTNVIEFLKKQLKGYKKYDLC
jgi:hypothetical protein